MKIVSKTDSFVNFIGLRISYLRNTYLRWSSDIRVEITSCSVEYKVTIFISFPALDKGEVTSQRLFKEILLSFKFSHFSWGLIWHSFLTFIAEASRNFSWFQEGTNTSRRIEGRDTCATSSQFLSQVSLGCQVKFELPVKVLLLENTVNSNIWSIDFAYLVVLQQEWKTIFVTSALIWNQS